MPKVTKLFCRTGGSHWREEKNLLANLKRQLSAGLIVVLLRVPLVFDHILSGKGVQVLDAICGVLDEWVFRFHRERDVDRQRAVDAMHHLKRANFCHCIWARVDSKDEKGETVIPVSLIVCANLAQQTVDCAVAGLDDSGCLRAPPGTLLVPDIQEAEELLDNTAQELSAFIAAHYVRESVS